MSGADSSKKLATLLKRLKTRFGPGVEKDPPTTPAWDEPLVDELVFSFLLWEATSPQARNAFKRLKESYIDYNELRVSLPVETAAILGERYPRGEERSGRLRAALFDLYKREYAVTFSSLADGGKRDVRAYLESLDGVPAYAVDRMMLLAFGAHAAPIDDRLRDLLADEGVIDSDTPCDEAASWLARQVKAEDALITHRILRAWADEQAPEHRKSRPSAGAAEDGRKARIRSEPRSEGRAESRSEARIESKPDAKADDKPGKRRADARKKTAKAED
ncbi:MAG: hypothetical protein IT435_01945 [Phycisphaerales bacterium]|nr:hypothetical protein [Phycisphaerales bacterium]